MIPKSTIEEWMFSIVRITTKDSKDTQSVATAFIFGYPLPSQKASIPFLVTNRHVIENQVLAELHFVTKKDEKPDLQNTITLPVTGLETQWSFHPNPKVDVAIVPFGRFVEHVKKQGTEIFFKSIHGNLVPTKNDYEEFDALEEILYIGYPSGLFDSHNNTPIIRKGTTASHLNLDYENEPKYLIEASVFGGSSGSPVFLRDNNLHWGKVDREPKDSRTHFIGIVAQSKVLPNPLEMMTIDTATQQIPVTQENFHLGLVFKPETIMESIESFAKKNDFKPIVDEMKNKEKN